MWLLPAFLFPVQIPAFYAKFWSLYANVSVFPSKWSVFYYYFILWVSNLDRHHVRSSGSWGGAKLGGCIF